MYSFNYKGYSIHGYFDGGEVKVFPPNFPESLPFKAVSTHAAKILITKKIKSTR